MPEAFIIDAVRTPVTRRGGGLSTVHPADLGAAQQRRDDVRAQVGGVRGGEATATAGDRGAHRVDNEGLGHHCLPV